METRNLSSVGAMTWLLVCFTCSGMSALMYEVVWMRSLELIFGTTTFAVATVLAAFMGGLAFGSYAAGRWFPRTGRHPLLVYAGLEALIAIWALLIPLLFDLLTPLYRVFWTQLQDSFMLLTLLRFLFCFLFLLIPTAFMGATLPVMSQFVSASADADRKVGWLYVFNTLGAVAGCWLAGFVLFRALGHAGTQWVAVALNAVALFGALILYRLHPEPIRREEAAPAPETSPQPVPGSRWFVGIYAISGLTAMLYEVAWSRVLVLVLGSSTYAYTGMLTTFLLGLALGAALGTALLRRVRSPWILALGAQALVAGATYAGILLVEELPYGYVWLFDRFRPSGFGILLLQFAVAFLVMVLPTLGLGAMFPITMKALQPAGSRAPAVVGWAYSMNTVGAIAGSLLAGFFLVPRLGTQTTLALGVLLNTLVVLALAQRREMAWKRPLWRVALLAVGLFLCLNVFLLPSWREDLLSSGVFRFAPTYQGMTRAQFTASVQEKHGEILFFEEGLTCTVTVYRNSKLKIMKVNGKSDASVPSDLPVPPGTPPNDAEGDLATQVLLGQLPMLLVDQPQKVLVIGLGSGVTVGSALLHPLQHLDCVELEQGVVRGSRYFDDQNNRPLEDPRLRMIVNDARNQLTISPEQYDVIISEPTNPWIPGSARLFTLEFLEMLKQRLKPGGVFCQWMQFYELAEEDFSTLLRTVCRVFPRAHLFKVDSDAILIAGPEVLDLEAMERRMQAGKADLARAGFPSLQSILARYLVGGEELVRVAGDGRINTDDNMFIEFTAPLRMLTHWENFSERFQMGPRILRHSTWLLPALGGDPSRFSPAFWEDLARAALEAEAYPASHAYASHALRQARSAGAASIAVRAMAAMGERDRGHQFWEAHEKEMPRTPELLAARREVMLALGFHDRADQAAADLLKADPAHPDGLYHHARKLFLARQFDACLETLKKIEETARGRFVDYPWLTGASLYHLGRFDEAERPLRAFVQAHPAELEAARVFGSVLHANGKLLEGVQVSQRVAQDASEQSRLMLASASGVRPAERSQRLVRAWELDPASPEANQMLAYYLLQKQEAEEAIKILSFYLKQRPDTGWALEMLAEAHEQLGDAAAAEIYRTRLRGVVGTVWQVPSGREQQR